MELYKRLVDCLKKEPNYADDEGNLKKWVVLQDVQDVSGELLALLMQDERLKEAFFRQVAGAMVFEQKRLALFLEQKSFLADSYTRYSKKIGLRCGGKYMSQNTDIELVWPYKDCMLEGGQTREEQQRNEIFFNQTLAQDEITQLKDPKVLTNGRKYTADGCTTDFTLQRNEKGAISDNLIIKGNNLLTLYSLLPQFAGHIGLVYIDPPYYFRKTKASDTFRYNSNFKLSSWLVFMRDRLEVAKTLMKPNGVILCHIKEDAVHWLKVLMEEVFGADNFVETFIWRNTDNPDSLSKKSRSSVEYIICFEKNCDASRKYVGKDAENDDTPLLNTGNTVHDLTFRKGLIHFNLPDGIYTGIHDRVELVTHIEVKNGINVDDVILRGEFRWGQGMLEEEEDKGTYFLVKSNKFSVRFQRKAGEKMSPEKYIEEQYLSKAIGVGSNEDASTHLQQLGIDFNYSKPESVVAFFIRAITKKDDVVLDFFLGSGTTAAVAHKMGRQYIGVDQMDYIETCAVERLRKVIGTRKQDSAFEEYDCDQGGVSRAKDVDWQGGGEFVYFELKKYNQAFMDEIEAAATADELLNILERIKQKSFIDYNVDLKELEKSLDDFKAMTVSEQKQTLCALLDKNQLYVNLSSIDDKEFECTAEEKRLTSDFYHTKG